MKKSLKSVLAIAMSGVLVVSLASCSVTDKLKDYFSEEEVITEPYTGKSEKPDDVAGVVAYFNKVSNKVKESKLALSASYDYGVNDFECENKYIKDAFPTVKSYILDNYLNKNSSKSTEYGESIKDIYPVAGEDTSSTLVSDDVITAVCAQNGDTYDVVIRLSDDYAPEKGKGVGSAFNLGDKEKILSEFAKVSDMFKVNDYSTVYKNCSIKCSVDRATDQIITVSYSCDIFVTASITGVGTMKDVGTTEATFKVSKTESFSLDWVDPATVTTEA